MTAFPHLSARARLRALLLFLLATVAVGATRAGAQTIGEKMNAGLHRVFGDAAQISVTTTTLTDAQLNGIRAASGFAYARTAMIYTISSGGRRVGYGVIDEVKGKAKAITYAVMVDNNLTVKDLEVLAYREPYGGEIQYEAFRRQFRGKSARDTYKVGVDLRNISGATISSNAVAGGTRKVMAMLSELKAAGALR